MNNAVFSPPSAPAPHMASSIPSSFEVPVDLVALPSQGKLYPPEHAFHNAESAEIRCMTAREEDLITSAAIIKQGLVMQKLLKACLMNKSVDVDSLLIGDRDALVVAIRIASYGSSYKARVTCPHCDHTYDCTFELNRMPIKPFGAEPVEPHRNMFEVFLPMSKHRVRFKLLTVGDERNINQAEERKRNAKIASENRITGPLHHQILSINTEEDPAKLSSMILNMRAGDSRMLRAHIAKVAPGVEMKQDAACPSCVVTSEVSVPIGTTFFWPDVD